MKRVVNGAVLILALIAGVGCGQNEMGSSGITPATVAVETTTTTAAPATTTTTACPTPAAAYAFTTATDSLNAHQAEYDSVKAFSGPNPQVVSNLEYLLGTAARQVERARADLNQAAIDLGEARTWDEYTSAQEMDASARDALVEAEAYQKKLQGDLARAKVGDPSTNQRLASLGQVLKDDRQRVAQATAELATCP